MVKILCFGDSNTFGYIPGGRGRYDRRTRWPGRLQSLLGEQYHVIEEGLNGRTTVFEDTCVSGRCGLDAIGAAVELYGPLDFLVVMLGTNDCKTQFHASAGEIAEGLRMLLKKAESSSLKPFQTLIISPAPLTEKVYQHHFGVEFDEASVRVSKELAREYEKLAEEFQCGFLDASKVTKVSPVDGVHLEADGHKRLAEAVAKKVKPS